jgi:hypothetical protein
MTTYQADEARTRHTRRSESGTDWEPSSTGSAVAASMRREPRGPAATMSQSAWRWARLLGGGAVLAVLFWRLGTGPFLDAIRTIDGWSLLAATCIAGLTTVCCAWRWSLVARGLGVAVPLSTAATAYYRSQFLNTTLPGGVLGDVDRAVRHGRDVGDQNRAMRAVGWERLAGQVIQIVLVVTVLLLLPSPVRSSMPVVAMAVMTAGLGVIVVSRMVLHGGPSRWGLVVRTAGADLRGGLLARQAWPGIVIASVVAVAGHAATFLIAARTAGSTASPARMLPLALLVLLAMGLPTNIAGWGPREGVAAWVTTAVVYGVMVLVANLPGAVLPLAARIHRGRTSRALADRPLSWQTSTAGVKGAADG